MVCQHCDSANAMLPMPCYRCNATNLTLPKLPTQCRCHRCNVTDQVQPIQCQQRPAADTLFHNAAGTMLLPTQYRSRSIYTTHYRYCRRASTIDVTPPTQRHHRSDAADTTPSGRRRRAGGSASRQNKGLLLGTNNMERNISKKGEKSAGGN